MVEQWLARADKLRNWQVAIIIAVIGFAVFFTGLSSPFMGDDSAQIVNNPVVHSIANIRLLFIGGTFYDGHGIAPLSGSYYRPLMITAYSVIYSLFGPNPIAFHVIQLALHILSAFFLFLFLCYSFKRVLALGLSLAFLVHPINSQAVYAIPHLQEPMFFLLGILALLMLVRFKSRKSLLLVAICLTLSVLTKETSIIFIGMALLYLFWFDRKRLLPFIGIMALPLVLYLTLRIHAVGLGLNAHDAPIDELNFGGRLLTVPSVLLFYIVKFIFPLKLASAYYWVYRTFSFQHVLLPLVIDVILIAIFVRLGFTVRSRLSKAQYLTYLFFSAWAALGTLVYLQIFPLDMTASETWFYFSMVGILGMVGVLLNTFEDYVRPVWFVVIAVTLLCLFGVRTAVRGTDWRNELTLAYKDISVSKEDYNAYELVVHNLLLQHKFSEAKMYAIKATNIYPTPTSYTSLGVALMSTGEYAGALDAFNRSIHSGGNIVTYENIGALMLVYGDQNAARQVLLRLVNYFHQDSTLWMYYALFEDENHDNATAQYAIAKAAAVGTVPQGIYDNIMHDQPFTLSLANLGKEITIK